jgi:hypothetical protein
LPHQDRRRIPPIANLLNGIDLHTGKRQPFAQLLDWQHNIYILFKPRNGHTHDQYLNELFAKYSSQLIDDTNRPRTI